MQKRTILTTELEPELKAHLENQASKKKVSLSRYVRAALKKSSKYKEPKLVWPQPMTKKDEQLHQTVSCKICNGQYINSGHCPAFGLKYRNSPCPKGEVFVNFSQVKVRNKIPWWMFWRKHYDIENIVHSIAEERWPSTQSQVTPQLPIKG